MHYLLTEIFAENFIFSYRAAAYKNISEKYVFTHTSAAYKKKWRQFFEINEAMVLGVTNEAKGGVGIFSACFECFDRFVALKKAVWFVRATRITSSWYTWSQLWFLRSRRAWRVLQEAADALKSGFRETRWSFACCGGPIEMLHQRSARRYR